MHAGCSIGTCRPRSSRRSNSRCSSPTPSARYSARGALVALDTAPGHRCRGREGMALTMALNMALNMALIMAPSTRRRWPPSPPRRSRPARRVTRYARRSFPPGRHGSPRPQSEHGACAGRRHPRWFFFSISSVQLQQPLTLALLGHQEVARSLSRGCRCRWRRRPWSHTRSHRSHSTCCRA